MLQKWPVLSRVRTFLVITVMKGVNTANRTKRVDLARDNDNNKCD